MARIPDNTEPGETPAEEWASGLVHALGAGLAVLGLAAMVCWTLWTLETGLALRLAVVSVFGLSLIGVYLASTLLHLTPAGRADDVLLTCDYLAIYLLIAGTYTPLMLVGVGGVWGWLVFGLVWGLSLTGITLRLVAKGDHERLSLASYLAAGWMGMIAAGPIIAALSVPCLLMILAGGLFYTGGVVFFLWRRLPFSHAIWHSFVLLGSLCHFAAVWHEIVAVG